MYISNMELIKQKLAVEGKMSASDIIKQILKDDTENPEKAVMRVGERYYDGRQDILEHDFRQSVVYDDTENASAINNGGTPIVNENNSNHHNVHNYYALQVDQKAAYCIGKAPSVTVEGAEKNRQLKEYENLVTRLNSDEEFVDTLDSLVVGASNKGVEWLHIYYDAVGKLRYVITPAEGCIPLYDTAYQKELIEFIRYYSIAVVRGGKEVLRKRVEWWTKQNVTYYEENDDGDFVLDSARHPNPHAHWYTITSVNGVKRSTEPHSWGKVPFIPLFNNSRHTPDICRIKGLLDAYNLISSASTNNQIDLVELYWMIQGYGGETAKAIQRKLQINKAVHISDPSGKISAEQVTLGVSERLEFLKMLRRDIFYCGMAVDVDTQNFGSAPSGVSLKFLYTFLDMKSDRLITKLKLAMKDFVWFVTQDMNRQLGTDYDSSLVRFDFNKSAITNDAETVNIISQSQGLVPDTILLSKHPMVDDVNQAIEDLKAQKDENQKRFLDSDIKKPDDGEDDD